MLFPGSVSTVLTLYLEQSISLLTFGQFILFCVRNVNLTEIKYSWFPVLTVVIIPVLELPIAFKVFRHQMLPFTVKIGARLVLPCPALIASIPPQSELPVEESSPPEVHDAAGLAVQGKEKAKLCVCFWRRLASAP